MAAVWVARRHGLVHRLAAGQGHRKGPDVRIAGRRGVYGLDTGHTGTVEKFLSQIG